MAFKDHREKVGIGNVPDLPAMGGDIPHIGEDCSNAVLVPLKRVVHFLSGPYPLPVCIFIHEFRGIHLTHLLYRLMVLFAAPVTCTAERVVHDKRPDDDIK